MKLLFASLIFLFSSTCSLLFGQQANLLQQRPSYRLLKTIVPLLTVTPDARAGAMGDVGAATSVDGYATFWNIAKLAFFPCKVNIGFSYTPWITHQQMEVDLYNLATAYKINQKQAVGFSARLNEIYQKDNRVYGQNVHSTEYYLSASYSRLLSDNMSLGVTLKYIHSNFIGELGYVDAHPGKGLAMDIGWYWRKDLTEESNLAIGATITDIGSKISYSDDSHKQYIPTNLRLGSAYTYKLNSKNSLTLALDFNKLMVPTPPVYEVDENGSVLIENDEPIIARGKDPNRPVINGMLDSFFDAPGGIVEEFHEIKICSGIEYWYNDLIAVRGGYFWEHRDKGDRKYITMGLGLKCKILQTDVSYLVPQSEYQVVTEKVRFSLQFNIGKE